MDVVVSSRQCEVSERFRGHVEDKLSRLEKHDHRIIRVDVVLEREKDSRNPERAIRVELTARSKGPILRAEAAGEDKMAALDLALGKMSAQMRRAADRRKARRSQPIPDALRRGVGTLPPEDDAAEQDPAQAVRKVGPVTVTGDGPLGVREKSHKATPVTLEQALYEMELVGHDFYLFVDKESERPSVVYRRHGYDYGVISLDLAEEA